MAREQGSNNYSNENYILLGDNNNIREIDSNFKILGFISNPKEITKEQYWYESQDIFNVLRDKVDTRTVDIIFPEPLLWNEKNKQSLKDTLTTECISLKSNNDKKSAIIPINLGNSHWTSLIVTKTPENDLIFTYNNPDGSSINPSLKGVLQEAAPEVPIIDLETKQQWNDYDCGLITIDNLVKIVNGEPIKSNLTENSAKEYATKLRQEHAEVIQTQKQREQNQQQNQAQQQQKVNEHPTNQQIVSSQSLKQNQAQQQQVSANQQQDNKGWTSFNNMWESIKRNPVKSVAMGLLLASWPVGTAIAGSIIAAKIGKDIIKEKYPNNKAVQFFDNIGNKVTQAYEAIGDRVVQSIKDIGVQIKNNPGKAAAVGAVILFTLPYSAVAAGVVLAGKVVKDVIVPPKQQTPISGQGVQNLSQQNPQQQTQQQQYQKQHKLFRQQTPIQMIKNVVAPPSRSNSKQNNKQQER